MNVETSAIGLKLPMAAAEAAHIRVLEPGKVLFFRVGATLRMTIRSV